ncbi:MAG: gliding motility-associated C-terminal domain-containing protein, partial [Bacteroidota bacterium]
VADSSMSFYMAKTDPMAALNCDEKDISPLDSISRGVVQMDSIHFESGTYELITDTVAYEFNQFTPEQEMPCFTPNVDDQSQEYFPCPCNKEALTVSWLKGAEYLWNTGETSTILEVDSSGIYTVNVNLCGNEVTSTFMVQYKKLTDCVIIQDNSPLCPGHITTLQVNHSYEDALSLLWSTGETEDSIHVTKAGIYSVDLSACGYTDHFSFDIQYRDIEEEDCKPVFIPNAFVPKSSQYVDNKVFKIYTTLDPQAFLNFDMMIFDRWGEKVFHTDDAFDGWDGRYKNKDAAPGVYLYQISYEIDLGGDVYIQSFDGQVVLVR